MRNLAFVGVSCYSVLFAFEYLTYTNAVKVSPQTVRMENVCRVRLPTDCPDPIIHRRSASRHSLAHMPNGSSRRSHLKTRATTRLP